MRQFMLGLSFSIVFMIGCAVGTMQQRSAIAVEKAPPGVQKWDIRCIARDNMGGALFFENGDGLENWSPALKKLGDAGWEPVWFGMSGAVAHGVCLKRPKS